MGMRLARPHDAVLGRVPGLAGMHDVADYPDAQTLPGLIIYRFEAPLFFANVGELRRRVQLVVDQEIEAYPEDPPRWFLLNVEANTEVDITAADGLRELQGDLAAQGILLGLVPLKRDLYEPLRRAGVVDLIGEDMLFPTLPVAEEAYRRVGRLTRTSPRTPRSRSRLGIRRRIRKRSRPPSPRPRPAPVARFESCRLGWVF
jgi:SulP family sulfate permease